jgi:hypothetical protein
MSGARDVADCHLPAELGLDPLNRKMRVYTGRGNYLPRLSTELPVADTEDDLGDVVHAVVHARPVD